MLPLRVGPRHVPQQGAVRPAGGIEQQRQMRSKRLVRGVRDQRGKAVLKDDAEALKYYQRCVKQGHAGAQFSLGLMYVDGRGVVKDEVEALKWCRMAAEQGYAGAQCLLGVM